MTHRRRLLLIAAGALGGLAWLGGALLFAQLWPNGDLIWLAAWIAASIGATIVWAATEGK